MVFRQFKFGLKTENLVINIGIHKAKSIRIGQWLRDEPTILKFQVLVWRVTQGGMLI